MSGMRTGSFHFRVFIVFCHKTFYYVLPENQGLVCVVYFSELLRFKILRTTANKYFHHFECCLMNLFGIFQTGAESLTDKEVIQLVKCNQIPAYQIEKAVNNPERGVGIRRQIVSHAGNFKDAMTNLPYKNYDYNKVCVSLIMNLAVFGV